MFIQPDEDSDPEEDNDEYSDDKFDNTTPISPQAESKKPETVTSGDGGIGGMQDLNDLLSNPTSTKSEKKKVESDNYSSDEEF